MCHVELFLSHSYICGTGTFHFFLNQDLLWISYETFIEKLCCTILVYKWNKHLQIIIQSMYGEHLHVWMSIWGTSIKNRALREWSSGLTMKTLLSMSSNEQRIQCHSLHSPRLRLFSPSYSWLIELPYAHFKLYIYYMICC